MQKKKPACRCFRKSPCTAKKAVGCTRPRPCILKGPKSTLCNLCNLRRGMMSNGVKGGTLMDTAIHPSIPFQFQASQPLSVYFPCPDCGTYFKDLHGFSDHMTFEHWWERPIAENYWGVPA